MSKQNKVFSENLLRYKEGRYKGKINWRENAIINAKVKFQYDDIKGEVEIINYEPKGQYLYIKYKDKEPFKITTGRFQQCMLGKLLNKYTNEFKIEIGTRFIDSKRDLTIIDREYREKIIKDQKKENQKWYKYKCNKCGWTEGWIIESELISQETGCSCCNSAPKTVVPGINDIPTTAPWMVKYFQGGYDEAKLYTKSSKVKILPICPDCGRIKNKLISIFSIYRNYSIGCSCSDGQSYPFKFMFNVLEQLNIEFETEFTPDWCEYEYKNKLRQGRYDFYFKLNNNKYIIETDGGFHNKNNSMSGQTKEESQYIDDEKDRLADKYGIKVIRINADLSDLEYIKNNILDKLNNLFDLSNIDWLKAEEFSLSNLCKKACELKRYNADYTTTKIGHLMKLSRVTIIKYLKKGSKLGWCNYNPKEESFKGSSKSGKMNGKPVAIFKDEIKLGIFESATELDRQSEKLFGIKLNQVSISKVCREESGCYKGFIFKYI